MPCERSALSTELRPRSHLLPNAVGGEQAKHGTSPRQRQDGRGHESGMAGVSAALAPPRQLG